MSNGAPGEQGLWAPGQPAGASLPTNATQDYFNYPITFTDLAADGTATQQIQIDASADFYWTQLTQISYVHGDQGTVVTNVLLNQPAVTILITDSGSNRNLMQGGVPLPLLCGTGQWPHYLRHPRRFARNSAISITLVSFDPTNAWDIYLNFEGFKTYNVG
jgi:hypothetical protein